MSGRAVEAAGDVDTLLLDKTGTITLGNRQATEFLPVAGCERKRTGRCRPVGLFADETPEGRSIVVLAKENMAFVAVIWRRSDANFIPFSAQTRISGVDLTAPGSARARWMPS